MHSNAEFPAQAASDRELRHTNLQTVEKYFQLQGQARLNRHELYAEDGQGGLWTTETGQPMTVQGKAGLRKAEEWNSRYFPDWRWSNTEIYQTQDPNFFWVENDGEGHIEFPGHDRTFYKNHYIHSFRMENGKIKQYREFMNICVEMRSLGYQVPKIAKPPF
ncbi:MAG: PhzA/PhzB family protein [Gammaproteobacteria bacterium]|nr:PhzA/PhzB family protein [Gammaproteobacteria bacterium]